jgi:acyl-CoA reductase-like NAD-dependent aldehyde dehydrogenase
VRDYAFHRWLQLQGYENGFFIGPTLFDHVKPTMKTYQEEIFGPVLQIARADAFEEAVELRRSTSTATASPSQPASPAWRANSRAA